MSSLLFGSNNATVYVNRGLDIHTSRMIQSQDKLSSGQRINKSSDDPVGLSLSQGILTQIKSYQQGLQNSQDGISLLNVADGSLSSITDTLMRMRELTLQAANDTNAQTQRNAIAEELAELASEIQRTADTTTFNNINLLNDPTLSIVIQFGDGTNLATNTVDISSALTEATLTNLGVLNGTAGFTSVTDIWNGTTQTSQLTSTTVAQNFLNDLDAALSTISVQRGKIGAFQSQLESVSEVLTSNISDLTESNGVIRDTDFAAETSQMTQEDILRQAAASVLTQTYGINRNVLSLLK